MEQFSALPVDGINLSGIWDLTPIGAFLGLVVTLFWLTSTGRYIPRSSHEREMAASNKRGDEWKEAAKETRTLNIELTRQNTALVESTKTSAEFFGTVMRDGGGKRVGQDASSST